MKLILLLVGVLVLVIIIKIRTPKSNKAKQGIPDKQSDKKSSIENDKVILIEGADFNDIKKALEQFCNTYNRKKTVAIVHLIKMKDDVSSIIFPYNISFDIFCYFVNYLYYPEDIFYEAKITAWCTTLDTDSWMTEKIAGKKVMLFIPENDNEYDNVYLTTEDNIGYKLGFAYGGWSELAEPEKNYNTPMVSMIDLKNEPAIEVK